MNTGQMMLVIGALMLLSILTLSVNSMLASKTTTMLQAEAELTAISVAQSMLDEIMVAKYDYVVSQPHSIRVFDSTKFTPIALLGPETADTGTGVPVNERTSVYPSGMNYEPPDTASPYQSLTKYSDIDDYNNYKRYFYSPSLGVFSVVDTVFYVSEINPEQSSSGPTFFKKIVVTVRHPNMYPPESMSRFYTNPWSGRHSVQLSDIAVYRRYL